MSSLSRSTSADPVPQPPGEPSEEMPGRRAWRVVDIVVGAVLAVAVGVVFWAWGIASNGASIPFAAITPGFQSFAWSIWLIGGVLGGLIIRKPGAALFVELVGAAVEMLIGNQWGVATLISGLTQGLGAELGFLLFGYRRFRLPVAWLAGGLSGLGMVLTDFTVSYGWQVTPLFVLTYAVAGILGGAFVAGTLSWVITRALAATGALHRFAAGRDGKLV